MRASGLFMGVIILLHGSFGIDSTWYLPGGDFYEMLAKQGMLHQKSVVSFAWSGSPTNAAMMQAATRLAQLITSYSEQEKITVIGHSHGGNVINLATQILHNLRDPKISGAYSARCSCPSLVQANTQLNYPYFSSLPYYSLSQTARSLVLAHEITRSITSLHSLGAKPTHKSTHSIEAIYLLGTPIDEKNLTPCLLVTQRVYNIFSQGDVVQPVLGLYKRTFSPHPQILNIEAQLMLNGRVIKPAHTQMHHPLVAQKILSIKQASSTTEPACICFS